jgi:hypothetical protein
MTDSRVAVYPHPITGSIAVEVPEHRGLLHGRCWNEAREFLTDARSRRDEPGDLDHIRLDDFRGWGHDRILVVWCARYRCRKLD